MTLGGLSAGGLLTSGQRWDRLGLTRSIKEQDCGLMSEWRTVDSSPGGVQLRFGLVPVTRLQVPLTHLQLITTHRFTALLGCLFVHAGLLPQLGHARARDRVPSVAEKEVSPEFSFESSVVCLCVQKADDREKRQEAHRFHFDAM